MYEPLDAYSVCMFPCIFMMYIRLCVRALQCIICVYISMPPYLCTCSNTCELIYMYVCNYISIYVCMYSSIRYTYLDSCLCVLYVRMVIFSTCVCMFSRVCFLSIHVCTSTVRVRCMCFLMHAHSLTCFVRKFSSVHPFCMCLYTPFCECMCIYACAHVVCECVCVCLLFYSCAHEGKTVILWLT
jgi:hypothetical protein